MPAVGLDTLFFTIRGEATCPLENGDMKSGFGLSLKYLLEVSATASYGWFCLVEAGACDLI